MIDSYFGMSKGMVGFMFAWSLIALVFAVWQGDPSLAYMGAMWWSMLSILRRL